MTNIILSIWIQDSRLRKTSWIQPLWIQDSRFEAQKKLLQSNVFGFKIQGWRPSGSWILNPTILDARSYFGILNLNSYPFGFKKSFWDLESWIVTPWIQEVFLGSWILTLESWILPPWIQEVFLGSWILNRDPLDSRFFFGILNLDSRILNPTPLDFESSILNLGMGTKLQKNAIFDHQKRNTVNTTKFAWKVGLGGYHTYIYIYTCGHVVYIYIYINI